MDCNYEPKNMHLIHIKLLFLGFYFYINVDLIKVEFPLEYKSVTTSSYEINFFKVMYITTIEAIVNNNLM